MSGFGRIRRLSWGFAAVAAAGLLWAPGAAAQGELIAEPEEVSFGAVAAGEQRSLPLSIRNIGLDPVTLTDAWLLYEEGAVTEPFSVDPGSCETVDVLEAGAACEITANFVAPQQSGNFEALVVVEGDGVEPAVALLSGESVPPSLGKLVADPTRIGFRRTRIGTVSAPRQVHVRNAGSAPIAVPPAAVHNNPNFRVSANDCPPLLVAGAQCTVSVVFAPKEGLPYLIGYPIADNTEHGGLVFGERNPDTRRYELAVALSGPTAPPLPPLDPALIKSRLASLANSIPRALRSGPSQRRLASYRAPTAGTLSLRVYGWSSKRRVLVAKGRTHLARGARHPLRLSLTPGGRKLLRQPKEMRINAVLSFKTDSGTAVKQAFRVTVKPPKVKTKRR